MIRVAFLIIACAHASESGSDHTFHRSWKTIPTEKDMSPSDLDQFRQGLVELESGQYESKKASFTTFSVEDAPSHMSVDNSSGMPEELQGIWWLENHPTFGHSLTSLSVGKTVLHGTAGTDQPGYVYGSLEKPGANAIPNNSGNKSKHAWFADHGLKFAFSRWGKHTTKAGDSSYFNTYMTGFYKHFPIPAAQLEGWTAGAQALWVLNPKRWSDPAKCFCNVFYDGPDMITRNNFGKFAYKWYRVVDGSGKRTAYWQQYTSKMASLGITSLIALAEPSQKSDKQEDVLV